MKSCFITALFIIFSMFAHAQEAIFKIEEIPSSFKNSPSKLNKPHFVNGDYKVSSLIMKRLENSDTAAYKFAFTYNNHGDELTESGQIYKNGQWEDFVRYSTEYDPEYNRTSFMEEYYDTTGWSISRKLDIDWEDGHITKIVSHTPEKSDSLKNAVFEYSDGGKLQGYAEKSYSDGNWECVDSNYFEYEDSGRLAKWTHYEGDDEKVWEKHRRYTYTYFPQGLLETTLYENWDDTVWHPRNIYWYFYDSEGRYLKIVNNYNYAEGWGVYYTDSLIYNASGRLKEHINTYYGSEVNPSITRYNYSYTENGLRNLLLTETNKGEGWKNASKEIYEYDQHGNCIKGESFYWDEDWKYKNNSAGIPGNDTLQIYIEMHLVGRLFLKNVSAFYFEAEYVKLPIGTEEETLTPVKFALAQNYPNPFNPETKISFSLPESGKASLKIYDILGREVAELVNGEMEKGPHTISFNGRNLSSGVYIYRLQSGAFTEIKKMMLLK